MLHIAVLKYFTFWSFIIYIQGLASRKQEWECWMVVLFRKSTFWPELTQILNLKDEPSNKTLAFFKGGRIKNCSSLPTNSSKNLPMGEVEGQNCVKFIVLQMKELYDFLLLRIQKCGKLLEKTCGQRCGRFAIEMLIIYIIFQKYKLHTVHLGKAVSSWVIEVHLKPYLCIFRLE